MPVASQQRVAAGLVVRQKGSELDAKIAPQGVTIASEFANIGKNSFHVVELDTVADRQQELGGRNGSRDRSLTSSKKDWSVS
jgi:hypothetical protein